MKILYFLLVVSFASYSQHCRFDYLKTDPVTQQKNLRTEEQSMVTTNIAGIYFSLQKGSIITLNVRYTVASIVPITIGFSNKLGLSLSDGQLIELTPAEVLRVEGGLSNNTMTASPRYIVSVEQLEKISSIGIDKIRMNTSQYYFDFTVKRKGWMKLFKGDVDCLLKEIR